MSHRRSARLAALVALVWALSPIAAFAGSQAPAAPAMVALPGGTPISVCLTSDISSSSAHEGDKIAFRVTNDVVSRGWLVIAAGAQGVGEVTSVESAQGNGRPGKLELQFDYVYAADGEKVRVTQTQNTVEGEQKKGAASTATLATYALLGPVGLFAHNWIKGRDVTLTPKIAYSVFVADTVHVAAVDRADLVTQSFAH